jgi:thioredoxin 1
VAQNLNNQLKEKPIVVKADTKTVNEYVGKCVVVFGATWCEPCKALHPTLNSISGETDIPFFNVDVDLNTDLASKYGVRGVPTVCFLNSEKKEIDRLVGSKSPADIRKSLAKLDQ